MDIKNFGAIFFMTKEDKLALEVSKIILQFITEEDRKIWRDIFSV